MCVCIHLRAISSGVTHTHTHSHTYVRTKLLSMFVQLLFSSTHPSIHSSVSPLRSIHKAFRTIHFIRGIHTHTHQHTHNIATSIRIWKRQLWSVTPMRSLAHTHFLHIRFSFFFFIIWFRFCLPLLLSLLMLAADADAAAGFFASAIRFACAFISRNIHLTCAHSKSLADPVTAYNSCHWARELNKSLDWFFPF